MDQITDMTVVAARVGPSWHVVDGAIQKQIRLNDFQTALEFVNRVGAVAEAFGHHPDIDIRWDTVTLYCRTHSIAGISEYDIELCRLIDELDGGEPAS